MAKEAALKDVSKIELAEAYSKLKSRTKNAQMQAKKEGEQLVEDVVTVFASGGLGYLMGQRHEQAAMEGMANGLAGEELETYTAEGGQIAGIDLDLLVGGAAAAAGMFKLAGSSSNIVRKVGIGGLSAYAARVGIDKGRESAHTAEE